MTDANFNPASDAATLHQRAGAMHLATAELLQVLMLDLPQEKQFNLHGLLHAGGRVGIEATTDANGTLGLCMVGFTPTGERLLLLTVQTPGAGHARH